MWAKYLYAVLGLALWCLVALAATVDVKRLNGQEEKDLKKD